MADKEVKTDNEYLKSIARKVGNTIVGVHSDNYYLKRIEDKISSGGGEPYDDTDIKEKMGYDNIPAGENLQGQIGELQGAVEDLDSGLDGKADVNHTHTESDITDLGDYISKSNTSGLVKNDGTIDTNQYLTQHQSLDSKTVTIEKLAQAESGFHASYVVKQGGVAISPSINIPKDFLLKSATLEVCTVADVPVQGYQVGDEYIDFVLNVKEGTATDEHLYLNVKDLKDDYDGDNSTIVMSNNVFSVKDGGITYAKLASAAIGSGANQIAAGNHTHSTYLEKSQTSYKGKNVVVDSTSGEITFENKPTIPTKVSDLTNDSGFISDVSGKLDIAQTSNKGKNVVVDNSTGNITFEDKPTIPDVSGKIDTAGTGLTKSGTTLSADIGGSSSTSGSKLVACNDSRLSDSRTPSSHTHGNIDNGGILKISGTAQADKNVVTDSNGKIITEAKPTIPTVVDVVADGNANAVSSNAVYDYIASIIGDIDTWLVS